MFRDTEQNLYREYFATSGLRPQSTDGVAPGKLWLRFVREISPKYVERLLRTRDLNALFLKDSLIESHLQFCERLSNQINTDFLARPECASLSEILETNLDHGYNHLRRTEKWKKEIDAHDMALRSNIHYLFFAPGAFLAVRFHDLFEVFTGVKEKHDAAAALLALGILAQNYGAKRGIPSDEWNKIACGTAFICLHHSKPENMPSTENLVREGLFNPVQILTATEDVVAEKWPAGEMFSVFPPYQVIRETIAAIKESQLTVPKFTYDEIEGLKRQTRAVAAADKLDSTFPSGLAATRTILTRPERPWYTRADGNLSIEEDLKWRIDEGGKQESICDFNRILFELTRTQTFRDLSPWVSYVFRYGLRDRAKYFLNTIPAFLEDDSEPYLVVYDFLEQNELYSFLVKAGVNSQTAKVVTQMKEADDRHKAIRILLRQRGIDDRAADAILYAIHSEANMVRSALERKLAMLDKLKLTEEEKRRIILLLQTAVYRQQESLLKTPGPKEVSLPYDSYYWHDVAGWMKDT